jgi:divalent metal cation (Fe/Co/Zn/Cd) transporter
MQLQVVQEAGCECHEACSSKVAPRAGNIQEALHLEYLTIGWNIIEGVIAVSAALLAGSVALLAFGIDSFIECASGGIMTWRLLAERNQKLSHEQIEALEHKASKWIAVSLFVLAGYAAFDAIQTLWMKELPSFTWVGVILTTVSMTVMLWLAREKRRLARALGSKSMEADAFQTTACWWLSVAALSGIALNGVLGWWWADPVAALVIAGLIVKEGRGAWEGERDCC